METKTKYIIIGVIAVIIVIAVIVAVAVTKGKSNDTDNGESFINEESGDYEPVSANDDVQVSFENMNGDLAEEFENYDVITTLTAALKPEATTIENIVTADKTTVRNNENTTVKSEKITTEQYLEQTTVKTDKETAADNEVVNTISSFFSGKYYFDGIMVSHGDKSPMEMAMDGENFIVYSEMDGIDMGILSLDGKFYLINPAGKKYTVLNSALQSMMDIDMDSIKLDFNVSSFKDKSPTEVTEAKYNGQPAVCYTYKSSENHIDFVVVNNEIIQMIQYDSNGTANTILQADEFTADFDKSMLSLDGYSKTNIISFVTDLMG
ncbi:MAG: hypothetical protein IJZ35_05715 [Clostridia bacterium]|nr:hypothetical protein [Clostridia bacterium]